MKCMSFCFCRQQYSMLKSPDDDITAKVVANRTAVVVKPMDLSMLMQNIGSYMNFEQFLADVEWMVHNCIILYTSKSPMACGHKFALSNHLFFSPSQNCI